ncbi:unnamed protein product, partial [Sphagnum balticum]
TDAAAETVVDPVPGVLVATDPDPAAVEIGTTIEAVPEIGVLVATIDAAAELNEPLTIGVTLPDPVNVALEAAATGTLVLTGTTVVEAAADPRLLVTLPAAPEALPATDIALGIPVLVARMLEIILAKSVVGVKDAAAEETGVVGTTAPVETPVEAAAEDGITPEPTRDETTLGALVALAAAALTGVLEAGSTDATGVLEAAAVESGVVDADVGIGANAVESIELTTESAELNPVPTDGTIATTLELLAAGATGVEVAAGSVDAAVPGKEIPEEVTLAAAVAAVLPALAVEDELTTPPGPNVIALPVEDETGVVDAAALVGLVVGCTITSGTDPIDGLVGRRALGGDVPVETAAARESDKGTVG